ncbi:methylated-DNA--[protein]-cysteine S-methyltransferase [uncultured Methanobrevibacter sp.]|uniref:methylated-DNA--[protein]-cysteine S-methyltransferase n=1 Tax=uncultured Methanobrevibacter sp. TaxID=253161 RepID=UPI0025F3408F|nr:methylated-DNA--[protein]-cysteine S-methyltransferase [uncultured Methanobrevibacter sp.]
MYYLTNYSSPIGDMAIISDGQSINRVSFLNQKYFKPSLVDEISSEDDLEIFAKAKAYLDDYFKGLNPEIDFKLNPHGTDFRLKVWKLLLEIPYGETVTYGQIAQKISPTMAAQAVGGAVGANPIAIMIPCHRVIGKNGDLTGYAAGLDKKIELLKIEGVLDTGD